METLLVLKQQLMRFYTRFEAFIVPVLKFLAMLFAQICINSHIGYNSKLKNPAIVLIFALLCSFLPTNVMVILAGLIIVVHVYSLSLECAVVVLFVFIIMYALYLRFTPKDAIAVLLTPVAFALKIPYTMPLAMGFVGNPLSCISVGCGTAVYYILQYIEDHEDALGASGSSLSKLDVEAALGGFKTVIDGLLKNDTMIVMVIAFSVTVVIVYVIRRLRINYSWQIALGVGVVACFVTMMIGSAVLSEAEVGVLGAIFGMLFSVVIILILQFFVFNVDYSRAEYVQFEDDEYYYYVKAVPKIALEARNVRVRRNNNARVRRDWDDEDDEDEF